MCIHIDYCKKCYRELDRVFRDGSNDEPHEEWEAPVIDGECTCAEVFRFESDEPCDLCKCQNCGHYNRDGSEIVKGFWCQDCIEEAFVEPEPMELTIP